MVGQERRRDDRLRRVEQAGRPRQARPGQAPPEGGPGPARGASSARACGSRPARGGRRWRGPSRAPSRSTRRLSRPRAVRPRRCRAAAICALAQGLDPAGDEDHLLDAEARIDRLDRRSSKSLARWRASRVGRAVPIRRAALRPVDPAQDEVEPAHALPRAGRDRWQSASARRGDDTLAGPPAGRSARRRPAAGRGVSFGTSGSMRLEGMAEGLVEPQGGRRAEAAHHRRARHGGELPDALDPEPVHGARRSSAASRRAATGRPATASTDAARRNDRPAAIARHGPGGARRVGDRGPGGDALPREPADEIVEECLPRSPNRCGDAGDVDPDAVGRIGSDHGRVADGTSAPARVRAASSSSGAASTTCRFGTSACACATVMPGCRPSACGACIGSGDEAARSDRCAAVTSGSSGGGSPQRRRMRSVGQVGRYSETTLLIARLEDPGTRFGAAAAQRDRRCQRARPRPGAGAGQRGIGRDAPAGRGGGRAARSAPSRPRSTSGAGRRPARPRPRPRAAGGARR